MKGWGRVSLLLALGVFLGAGCGGRTSALGDGYGPEGSGADGSGADGNGGSGTQPRAGASSIAGRPSPGGAPSYGGTIGVGGSGIVGGGYPGGAPYGGYPGFGGAAYGGYPAFGGAYGFGGTYAFGGAYPGGGAGGFPTAGTGFGGNPNQPGGTCCEAQMEPSCRPRAVAQCVCNAAPYCCDKLWDAGCASLVERLGCGYCDRFDCDTCLNQSCSFELSQCYQDFGCLSIFSCMQASSCEPFQCYTDGQCKAVIDQWGGPGGNSMSLLLTAYSCAIQSGCPCN